MSTLPDDFEIFSSALGFTVRDEYGKVRGDAYTADQIRDKESTEILFTDEVQLRNPETDTDEWVAVSLIRTGVADPWVDAALDGTPLTPSGGEEDDSDKDGEELEEEEEEDDGDGDEELEEEDDSDEEIEEEPTPAPPPAPPAPRAPPTDTRKGKDGAEGRPKPPTSTTTDPARTPRRDPTRTRKGDEVGKRPTPPAAGKPRREDPPAPRKESVQFPWLIPVGLAALLLLALGAWALFGSGGSTAVASSTSGECRTYVKATSPDATSVQVYQMATGVGKGAYDDCGSEEWSIAWSGNNRWALQSACFPQGTAPGTSLAQDGQCPERKLLRRWQ